MSCQATFPGANDMKGRHFGFLCVLCMSWVSTRVAVNSVFASSPVREKPNKAVATAFAAKPQSVAHKNHVIADAESAQIVSIDPTCCRSMPMEYGQGKALAIQTGKRSLLHLDLPHAMTPEQFGGPPSPIELAFWSPPNGLTDVPNEAPLSVYAYSFWRNSGGANPLGLAQYGGSQSGFVATYRVAPRLSLLVRGAVAHDHLDERDMAVGIRWSPFANSAIAVTSERRFRNGREDNFAIYLSGGKSASPLPMHFKLDAFGQAGYVSGAAGGPFFDGQARATRDVKLSSKYPIKIGAGVWAGGQEGAARLDIGPTIGTHIAAGKTVIRLDADWRWRVAGDARPDSGPAVTLSTSF